ncbi:hypothetical protein L7F22_053614 [Adiantum nelumboides]|nr:hypothetical protein [Adiantum nelumboides]
MCLEEERLWPEPAEDGSEQDPRPPIQRLYEFMTVFFEMLIVVGGKGIDMFEQRHRECKESLMADNIKPIDVGLDESMPPHNDRGFGFFGMFNGQKGRHSSMVSRWAPPISYKHIYECQEFSMGIFCLPTSAVIPLHNHPGMTVFSKLLYGSMHVKAYDWVDLNKVLQPRLAKLVVDRTMSAPCEPAVLYPTSGGNMHAFTAVTSCAVLDILAPPYSAQDGRHCTYYRDFPYSSFASSIEDESTDGIDLAWLEECQPSDDFIVDGAPYSGPRIIP